MFLFRGTAFVGLIMSWLAQCMSGNIAALPDVSQLSVTPLSELTVTEFT